MRLFIVIVIGCMASAVFAEPFLSAGYNSSCAMGELRSLCWGETRDGLNEAPHLQTPRLLSTGGYHSCALDDTGVVCWGTNNDGQTSSPSLLNPTQVAAGQYHSCAIDTVGVHCWGSNYSGQANPPDLVSPSQVSVGYYHSCAIDEGQVQCWGYNHDGQTNAPLLSNPIKLTAGFYHSCALDDTGVVCWGGNDRSQATPLTLSNPRSVSAGGFHTCALDDSGVVCWGNNVNGQSSVPELSKPDEISAGHNHTCAIDETGVVCWCSNSHGQTHTSILNVYHSQDHIITANDGVSYDQFGASVAIENDRVLIGAVNSSRIDDSGSVYLFSKDVQGRWKENGQLRPLSIDLEMKGFGRSVSLAENIAFVGAVKEPFIFSTGYSGAVSVFNQDGDQQWNETQKISSITGLVGDNFSRAIAADGDTLIVSASGPTNSGVVYVFHKGLSGQWLIEQTIDSPSNTNDFGYSVAIEGDTVFITAHKLFIGPIVYIFHKGHNGQWREVQSIQHRTASDFGKSIDLYGDKALIASADSAYIFTKDKAGQWQESQKLTVNKKYFFVSAVAISQDTLLIGAKLDDREKGAVYVFTQKEFKLKSHQSPSIITGAVSDTIALGSSAGGTLLATDVNGLTDGSYFTISEKPTYGTATINLFSGTWFYRANERYLGVDTFIVLVTDDKGGTTEQTITITIDQDNDGDTVLNSLDNCVDMANADQANLDADSLGDACDSDIDGDGFTNAVEQAFGGDYQDASDRDKVMASIEAFSLSDEPLARRVPAMAAGGLFWLLMPLLALGAYRHRTATQ